MVIQALPGIFMKGKFYTNIALFLLFVLVLFTGCKPALLGEFLLSDEEKETVPFKGTETVTYMHNDTLISLVCEYRKDTTTEATDGAFTNDYYISETDKTMFKGDSFDIIYYLQAKWEWYSFDYIGIQWHDKGNALYGGTSFIIPLDTDYLKDSQGYLEKMTVLGTVCQSVFYDSLEVDTSSSGQKKPIAFFYSKDAGLIRMDFQDGSSWELKEIEWK